MLMIAVVSLYLMMSLVTFCMYGIDKSAARKGAWRISENALLAAGLFCGWPGAVAGQFVFRHKTSKVSFLMMFWLTVLLNAVILIAVISAFRFPGIFNAVAL